MFASCCCCYRRNASAEEAQAVVDEFEDAPHPTPVDAAPENTLQHEDSACPQCPHSNQRQMRANIRNASTVNTTYMWCCSACSKERTTLHTSAPAPPAPPTGLAKPHNDDSDVMINNHESDHDNATGDHYERYEATVQHHVDDIGGDGGGDGGGGGGGGGGDSEKEAADGGGGGGAAPANQSTTKSSPYYDADPAPENDDPEYATPLDIDHDAPALLHSSGAVDIAGGVEDVHHGVAPVETTALQHADRVGSNGRDVRKETVPITDVYNAGHLHPSYDPDQPMTATTVTTTAAPTYDGGGGDARGESTYYNADPVPGMHEQPEYAEPDTPSNHLGGMTYEMIQAEQAARAATAAAAYLDAATYLAAAGNYNVDLEGRQRDFDRMQRTARAAAKIDIEARVKAAEAAAQAVRGAARKVAARSEEARAKAKRMRETAERIARDSPLSSPHASLPSSPIRAEKATKVFVGAYGPPLTTAGSLCSVGNDGSGSGDVGGAGAGDNARSNARDPYEGYAPSSAVASARNSSTTTPGTVGAAPLRDWYDGYTPVSSVAVRAKPSILPPIKGRSKEHQRKRQPRVRTAAAAAATTMAETAVPTTASVAGDSKGAFGYVNDSVMSATSITAVVTTPTLIKELRTRAEATEEFMEKYLAEEPLTEAAHAQSDAAVATGGSVRAPVVPTRPGQEATATRPINADAGVGASKRLQRLQKRAGKADSPTTKAQLHVYNCLFADDNDDDDDYNMMKHHQDVPVNHAAAADDDDDDDDDDYNMMKHHQDVPVDHAAAAAVADDDADADSVNEDEDDDYRKMIHHHNNPELILSTTRYQNGTVVGASGGDSGSDHGGDNGGGSRRVLRLTGNASETSDL